VRKLVASGKELRFVYEAGRCGYYLYRQLKEKGLACKVVGPSMVPKKSGERIKTDRRDAVNLARLERAGELTAVHVPEPEDEAMRDLSRAREAAKRAETQARHQLQGLLLRHGFQYSGKTPWSKAHWLWLADVKLPQPAQQIVFQEYVDAISEAQAREQRLVSQIRTLLPQWRLAPVVQALQALRGVSLVTAVIMVAEVGDLRRFTKPRQLMAYLGLVPSEHSSGPRRRLGAITKAGKQSCAAGVGRERLGLSPAGTRVADHSPAPEQLAKPVCEIAWRAQLRLCARYRRLTLKGKTKQVVVTAIARELAAFMWAIAQQVPVSAG